MGGADRPSGVTVGRLAPSPTGGLHVGHARTFLLAWLAARSGGGGIVLRMEDLDPSRARREAIGAAVEDLRWLGLDWDAGPFLQSERLATYREALERLKRSGRVYPCTCTRADVARSASAPHADEEGPRYPGTCAARTPADAERLGGRPFAWRFRVPTGPIAWEDLVRGPLALDPALHGGDFIVARSGGTIAYQLAVVCDDAAMGVNQVVRAEDLIPSTPRQVLLFQALGWHPPRFGHVGLVIGPDGRRLAKRDGSIQLAALRQQGLDPQRLVGWLACSLGLAPRPQPSRPADWIPRFDFRLVPQGPWPWKPSATHPE